MDELSMLSHCRLCPRACGVNRLAGERGFCGVAGAEVLAARAALHFWEEPCLSGERGSGAVFFSGCTLRCCFCQNREISRGEAGAPVTVERLAEIFLELQQKGAHNLNLVTPTHYVPQIIAALKRAKAAGFSLPVVYNSSGYERVETLQLLAGLVDVYLPDMKYHSGTLAGRLSAASDYPERALAALDEMVRQTGAPAFDSDGMMRRGVIVRHLALPGQGRDSRAVLKTLLSRYGGKIWLSIMNQYTPPPFALDDEGLDRRLTRREYGRLIDYALRHGAENAFIQEEGTAEESFIPPFDLEGIGRQD